MRVLTRVSWGIMLLRSDMCVNSSNCCHLGFPALFRVRRQYDLYVYINSTSPAMMCFLTAEYRIRNIFPSSNVISSPLRISSHITVQASELRVYLGNVISPSIGVLTTRQKIALSISGFSIISSFRESLKFCKCAGKESVKACAYNDVSKALCLPTSALPPV